MNRCLELLTVR